MFVFKCKKREIFCITIISLQENIKENVRNFIISNFLHWYEKSSKIFKFKIYTRPSLILKSKNQTHCLKKTYVSNQRLTFSKHNNTH